MPLPRSSSIDMIRFLISARLLVLDDLLDVFLDNVVSTDEYSCKKLSSVDVLGLDSKLNSGIDSKLYSGISCMVAKGLDDVDTVGVVKAI